MADRTNLSDAKPVRCCNGEVLRLKDPTAKVRFTRSGDRPHLSPMRNLRLNCVTTDHPNYGHDVDTDGPYTG